MSYETINYFRSDVRMSDVHEFLDLLGYKKSGTLPEFRRKGIASFAWFSHRDYESTSGVDADAGIDENGTPFVYTRTPVSRSLFDLEHQNRTIKLLFARFGGRFETDAGKNRCRSTKGIARHTPAARGLLQAYTRFGLSIGRIHIVRSSMAAGLRHPSDPKIHWSCSFDPRIIGNNLLLPYLTAAMEDYFKSAFIALLRYSEKKEAFFKASRLNGSQLARISSGQIQIEEGIAESLPFQRLTSVCEHFRALEPALDLAGCLRKPYRRRRKTLLESIDEMVERRHCLIHQNELAEDYLDPKVDRDIKNLTVAVDRTLARIASHFRWTFTQDELE